MEIWKPVTIKPFNEVYEVSNKGRVRSIKYKPKRVLRQMCDKNGYKVITLYHKEFKKTCKVARLVALAFIPNPLSKPEVNHLKRKTDNRVESLEWATHSENMKHAYSHKFIPPMKGERHGMAKLTENQVREIRKLYKEDHLTQKEIGIRFNICNQQVSHIVNFKSWSHIK